MTRQRRVILDEIRQVRTHPTADEVYELVRKRLPRISLGTVYRNLETLSEWGLIQKLDLAGSQRRFDGNTNLHYHVRCTYCGRVDDLAIEPIGAIEQVMGTRGEYLITGYHLEFTGICPTCRHTQKDADPPARQTNGEAHEKP